MEIIIKDYTKTDIRSIAEEQKNFISYHNKFDKDYYSGSKQQVKEISAYLKKRTDNSNFRVFVANKNKKIIGYVMGWIDKRPPIYKKRRVGYLSNIFVKKNYRDQGLGKILYFKMEEWFLNKKVDFIEIKADCRNLDTVQKFRKYGFKDLSITFYKKIKK
ncbi:MAG TPA: GNAT family N-acetyltransferase [Ignavibacteria bacterium]|nr:GNAT family N-acetyltransferase [Ignavibacteria bacterium]